ncbi:MAG: hypothetical protein ABWK53_05525 [Anaerolineales bacterium]
MAKYAKYQRPVPPRPPDNVHPIWRGIGCLMMILVPILSYALTIVLVETGIQNGWPIPPQLLGRISFPGWVWNVPVLEDIARFIHGINNLLAILVFFVVILGLLSVIFSFIYSLIYSAFAPPLYTPVDAPPPRRKAKPYKR